jgi:membrane associated rhomboid family serine protease
MKLRTIIRKPFRYEFWNAALILIGINLVMYLLTYLYPALYDYLSLNPRNVVQNNMYWQLFTYQFIHGNNGHLASNMIGLFFFGTTVERRTGSKEFLLLYLLAGVLCGVFSFILYVLTGTWNVALMGASGAIFAILLAYAVLFPGSTIYLMAIIPIPAPLLILAYAGLEVFNMLAGINQGVAHSTHLIGFAVAWIYFLVRFGINPIKVWSRRL